ncbi:MAG: S-layer homology domain-containing protein [Bacillota bacterium]|nr:S-layer homology domain-containing protein [Bacillota bacterium]
MSSKRISFFLIFVMITALVFGMCTVSVSADTGKYSDIDKNASYFNAVELLSDLKLLTGYSNGSFAPDAHITRSEFAAVVCRALGLEDAALGSAGNTVFADVPAGYWASGYINLAVGLKIINGYGDGNFGPEDDVLYEDAIKMIVSALGYTPDANEQGGYPDGYISVALGNKMLSSVSGAKGKGITRSMVAQLVYNSLEVPIMQYYSASTYNNYINTNQFLLDRLGIEKVEGYVTRVPGSSDTSLRAGKAEFDVTKMYQYGSGDKRVFKTLSTPEKHIINQGDIDASVYLQYSVIAYIKNFDDTDAQLVAISTKSSRNDIVELNGKNIIDSKLDLLGDKGRLSYYTDDDQTKSTSLSLDESNISLFLNSRQDLGATFGDVVDAIKNNLTDGYFQFLDNDGDGNFDVVYIETYVNIVVSDISSKTYKITGLNRNIILNEDDSDYNFEIYLRGKKVDFSAITVGDTLSICGTIENNNLVNGRVDILEDNVVEGEITTVDNEDKAVYIDGVKYEYTTDDDFSIHNEGVFYLDKNDSIFYYERSSKNNGTTLAFATYLDRTKSTRKDTSIRILSTSGEWKTYPLASKVYVNGATSSIEPYTLFNDWNDYMPSGWNGSISSDGVEIEVYSLVTYKLNSSGYISKINFDLTKSTVTSGDYKLTTFGGYYSDSSGKLSSGVYADSSTLVFNIDDTNYYGANEGDISVNKENVLVPDNYYSGTAYIDTETRNALAVVGTDLTGGINYNQPFMIVSSVVSTYEYDTDLMWVRGYKNGDYYNFYYDPSDVKLTDHTLSGATSVKKGDIITYTDADIVTNLSILFRPSDVISGNKVTNPYTDTTTVSIPSQDDATYIYGLVRKNSNKSLQIALNDTVDSSVYLSAKDANVYSYDAMNYASPKITVDSISSIETDKDIDKTLESDTGDFIFARVYDDSRIKDIVIITRDFDYTDPEEYPPVLAPTITASSEALTGDKSTGLDTSITVAAENTPTDTANSGTATVNTPTSTANSGTVTGSTPTGTANSGTVTGSTPTSTDTSGTVTGSTPTSTDTSGTVTGNTPTSTTTPGTVTGSTPASTATSGTVTGSTPTDTATSGTVTGNTPMDTTTSGTVTGNTPTSTDTSGTVTGNTPTSTTTPGTVTGSTPTGTDTSGTVTGITPTDTATSGTVTGSTPTSTANSGTVTGNTPTDTATVGTVTGSTSTGTTTSGTVTGSTPPLTNNSGAPNSIITTTNAQTMPAYLVDPVCKGIAAGAKITILGKEYVKNSTVFDSIQTAVNTLPAGSSVSIASGVYNEDIIISKSIKLEAMGSSTCINGTIKISANNVTLSGLTIVYNRTAAGENGVTITSGISASTITISNCVFANAGKGTSGVALGNFGTGTPVTTGTDLKDSSSSVQTAQPLQPTQQQLAQPTQSPQTEQSAQTVVTAPSGQTEQKTVSSPETTT